MGNSSNSKVLIIGPIPPPVGGVSIHVDRVNKRLDKDGFSYHFINTQTNGITSILKSIPGKKLVHIHVSNPMVRVALLVVSRLFGVYTISTFHGKIFNHGTIKNFFQTLSVFFSSKPIVLNQLSFPRASKVNQSSEIITSFMAPVDEEVLSESVQKSVDEFKAGKDHVFCTNAYKVSIDKDGNDIYSIFNLVELFQEVSEKIGLVIVDPIRSYRNEIDNRGIKIPENVLFINEMIPFIELIKQSSAFLRATTTDGDSISVREALYFKTPVIASDCVDRPEGCQLFDINNLNSLKEMVESFRSSCTFIEIKEAYDSLMKIYKQEKNLTR